MNWNTYKTLTTTQKEEYDFKFRDNPLVINPGTLVGSVTILLLVVTQFIMTIYLAITDEAFEALKDQVIVLLQTTFRIVFAISIIIVFFSIGSALHIIYRIYTQNKWMKKRFEAIPPL